MKTIIEYISEEQNFAIKFGANKKVTKNDVFNPKLYSKYNINFGNYREAIINNWVKFTTAVDKLMKEQGYKETVEDFIKFYKKLYELSGLLNESDTLTGKNRESDLRIDVSSLKRDLKSNCNVKQFCSDCSININYLLAIITGCIKL